MAEAQLALSQCEAATKKLAKAAKGTKSASSFPPGTEWELLHSDAVILLGVTHALRLAAHSCILPFASSYCIDSDHVCSESYMGYVQCLYAMNR